MDSGVGSGLGDGEGHGVGDGPGSGWWRADNGFWYPAEAVPGEPWTGPVVGPDGELPPGPGWWLASDHRWYPPDLCPGRPYPEVVAVAVAAATPVAVPAATGGSDVGTAARRAVRADSYLGAQLEAERRRATTVITAAAVAMVAGATAMTSATDAGAGVLVGRLGLLPLVAGGVFAAIGGVQYLRSQLER